MRTRREFGVIVLGWAALALLFGGVGQACADVFHASTLGTLHVSPTNTYYDGSDGTLFVKVALPAGATALQFNVTGGVSTAGVASSLESPDGLSSTGAVSFNFTNTRFAGTYQGTNVGGTTGIDPALFGIFFSPSFVGVPADSANYRSDSGIVPDPRTLSLYSPSVNQPFWIGDGLNQNNNFGAVPAGTNQTFNIPAGATFLLLGLGADPVLGDNFGPGFNAAVFDNSPLAPPPTVPEPSSLVLFGLGGLALAAWRRRRRAC